MIAFSKVASLLFAVANVWMAVATSSPAEKLKIFHNGVGTHLIRCWPQYYFGLVLVALVLLLVGIRQRDGRRDEFLRHILDLAVERDLTPGGVYDDRECKATVFRYDRFSILAPILCWLQWKQWAWPWHGWLVPIVRSGGNKLPRFSRTVFMASSPARRGMSYHGVAGAIWAKGFHQILTPASTSKGRRLRTHDRDVAKKMYLTDSEYSARQMKGGTLSPYIYGRRIELSGSRRWGVVVFDAPAPLSIKAGADAKDQNLRADQLVVGVLSRAIEWGKS